MKKSYLGVQHTPRKRVNRILTPSASEKFKNPFSSDKDKVYYSLGDKILIATETGESLGLDIKPSYNGNDNDDIDVMTSFKHDNFDIAEQYGKLVEESTPVVPKIEPTDE